MSMDAAAIRQWLALLDHISYYDLFRTDPKASFDELRTAFHLFAETFHPDVHRGRHPNEQEAIGRIYRRGSEAWRILSDQALRARYDEALANGILRPENLIVEMEGHGQGAGARRLVDQVRSPGARPFVVGAEERLKNGDPKQAKIQLVMAMHIDRNNPALEAFAKELDLAIAAKVAKVEDGQKKA
jgi:DnaJ-class molecular chaperone